MHRVSVWVDDTLYQRLNCRALSAGLALSDFIRSVFTPAVDLLERGIHSSQNELLAPTIQALTMAAMEMGARSPEGGWLTLALSRENGAFPSWGGLIEGANRSTRGSLIGTAWPSASPPNRPIGDQLYTASLAEGIIAALKYRRRAAASTFRNDALGRLEALCCLGNSAPAVYFGLIGRSGEPQTPAHSGHRPPAKP